MNSEILIPIPMKSAHTFVAWLIEPFPMMVSNTILTINDNSRITLVSADRSLLTLTTLQDLSNFKFSYLHFHLCPAYIFAFTPVSEAQCELALVQINGTDVPKECIYVHYSSYKTGVSQTFYWSALPLFPNGHSSHLNMPGWCVNDQGSRTLFCS